MVPLTVPRAAIDLGSNSALLLVLDDAGGVVLDLTRVVGLGRGLGDGGTLAPDRVDAAVACLVDYARAAARAGVPPEEVRAVATSAARRARDVDAFVTRVVAEAGVRLRVIGGDEEAALVRQGALSPPDLLPRPEAVAAVVDVGGGSTELSVGVGAVAAAAVSLELGTVRATEAWLGLGRHDADGLRRLRDAADALLATTPAEEVDVVDVVVGVAGTATTLAAWRHGQGVESARAVHGLPLTRDDLAAVVDRFLPLAPDERRAALPIAPERADYVVAGAAILDRALARLGADRLVVSGRDLRHGLLAADHDAVTSRGSRV